MKNISIIITIQVLTLTGAVLSLFNNFFTKELGEIWSMIFKYAAVFVFVFALVLLVVFKEKYKQEKLQWGERKKAK